MVVKRFKLGQVHVLLLLRQIQKMMAMGLAAGQGVGCQHQRRCSINGHGMDSRGFRKLHGLIAHALQVG